MSEFPRARSPYRADDFEEGEGVIYTPQYGPCEDGIVTSIGTNVVFVRYTATQAYGTATYPHDLFKLSEPESKLVVPPCCGGGPQWGHAWECPRCPE